MINEVVPALVLLTGALLILVGPKLSRRFGLPDAFGGGVALCIIAISVWLFPADWRDWWTGESWGDRLLTSVRIVGLTGMLFLAGTRFNSGQMRSKFGLMLGFGFSAGVLLAVVVLLLKPPGGLNLGPIVLVAATVTASSLWLPGELSPFDEEDNNYLIDWQAGAVVFTALAMLAVYFYDIFAVIRHARAPSATVYIVVALYESVKLLVLFAFAYFISTRFLARAEGRISASRTTIGFVLIATLIFGLAAITTNQLGAIAWAFVAGALWRRSERGNKFSESERPLASAALISFVFLPALLQSHGRRLTGFWAFIIAVLAAMVLKWILVWVGMRSVGTSSSDAMRVSAVLVGPGEVGILLLGFGVTRWAIEPPVYLGILGYALVSSVFIPLVWHVAVAPRRLVAMGIRNAMKSRMKTVLCPFVFSLATVSFSSSTSSAQQSAGEPSRQERQLGKGVSIITQGLMEIGWKTRLFLVFGDKIPLTAEQRKRLERTCTFGFRCTAFNARKTLKSRGTQAVADAKHRRSRRRQSEDEGDWGDPPRCGLEENRNAP